MHANSPAMMTSMLLPWTEKTYVAGLGQPWKDDLWSTVLKWTCTATQSVKWKTKKEKKNLPPKCWFQMRKSCA